MRAEHHATVVVVDDDQASRYAVSRVLRRAGFLVDEAACGEEALALAARDPDLIVLDVNLPDINGFDVCRRIKADPATASIAVLHLSATQTGAEARTTGLEGGADAYLTGPVEPSELLATVRALLRVRRAERAVRASATQWQATFDAIRDGVALVGADGVVVRCNAALARVLDRGVETVVGSRLADLLPADLVAPAAATGGRLELQGRIGPRWYDVRVDPVPGDPGQAAGQVYILSDVTERRERDDALRLIASVTAELAAARESADALANVARLVVPQLADWCVVELTGTDGRLHQVASHERGVGQTRADPGLSGRVAASGRAEVEPDRLCVPLVARDRAVGAMTLGVADGARRYEPADLALAENLAHRAAFAVERDRLLRQTQEALVTAQEAVRSREAFFARASHELRTPLTAALGMVKLLGRAIDGALTEPPENLVRIASRNLDTMLNLVNDLLDAAKLASGEIRPEFERLPLATPVEATLDVVLPQAQERGVAVRSAVPGDLTVRADALKLEQVLINLLANAVKFTPHGGEVLIEAERSGPEVVIRVRDTGRGIAPEHLEKIFEPFFEAERGMRRSAGRGTGLGLAICRQLVSLHGGTIEAASAGPGRGSTFTVRLPASAGAEEAA